MKVEIELADETRWDSTKAETSNADDGTIWTCENMYAISNSIDGTDADETIESSVGNDVLKAACI
jgi:hypothetical protein